MRNFSYAYIEKYSPSKQQLKTYLLKKYLKLSVSGVNKTNIKDLIDVVLEDLEKSKGVPTPFAVIFGLICGYLFLELIG